MCLRFILNRLIELKSSTNISETCLKSFDLIQQFRNSTTGGMQTTRTTMGLSTALMESSKANICFLSQISEINPFFPFYSSLSTEINFNLFWENFKVTLRPLELHFHTIQDNGFLPQNETPQFILNSIFQVPTRIAPGASKYPR